MESTLIIIRGNSGSGKTTTAKRLQQHLGRGTLLVSQDVVRRDMLKVQDRDGNLSMDLIRQITEYGRGKCEYVIVEGIFSEQRYGDMLRELIQFYNGKAHTYYYDLSFQETVRRHNARSKRTEFGEDSLRAWWNAEDYLHVDGEVQLTDEMTQDEIVEMILEQI
ncbi:AAA family ATPase [Rossellomorea vietnamensis]|uniref:AAA family ATPase n=1 Tax=Rossellomorea vietnamensis TaxID=218284 RepID=A0A6I6UCS5_9BACI|nr:kinase [Rossellomorea vietnamensis]QHE60555.1 AAA family ATPase [Rossellomorea vietnamensis]